MLMDQDQQMRNCRETIAKQKPIITMLPCFLLCTFILSAIFGLFCISDYESSEAADCYMTAELAPDKDRRQGKITIIAASVDDSDDCIYVYLSNLSADAEVKWNEDVNTVTSSENTATQYHYPDNSVESSSVNTSGSSSSDTSVVNSALTIIFIQGRMMDHLSRLRKRKRPA